MTTRTLLAINPQQGYAPDQITESLTLGQLAEALEEAIERYGEDSLIVTIDNANRYGAGFGSLSMWEDLFTDADPDGDDEDADPDEEAGA